MKDLNQVLRLGVPYSDARRGLLSNLVLLTLLITALLCNSAHGQSKSCGGITCGGSDLCCMHNGAPTCYNPQTHSCVESRMLCAKGNQACGDICYNPLNYDCCDGRLCEKGSAPSTSPGPNPSPTTTAPPPSAGCDRLCGGLPCCHSNGVNVCYNPATHSCCDNRLLCGLNDGCCGPNCYDTSLYTCSNGQLLPRGSTSPAPPPPTPSIVPTPSVAPTATATATPTYSPAPSYAPTPPADLPPSSTLQFGKEISLVTPPFLGRQHTQQVDPNLWGSVNADRSKAFETNRWWNNLVLGSGGHTVSTLPYMLRAKPNGLHVCFPRRLVADAYILNVFLHNVGLSAVETLGSHSITAYDDLSVTVKFENKDQPSRSLVTPLVRGSPYVTAEYTNLTPLIDTQHAIVAVNGASASGSVTGTKFKLSLNNGQNWVIYTSSSITLQPSGSALTASKAFTGVIRIAYVPTESSETHLEAYKDAYPIGGDVSYTVPDSTPDEAVIIFNWKKKSMSGFSGAGYGYESSYGRQSTSPLLIMALPHHTDILQNPRTVSLTYQCIKGFMTGVVGDQWTLKETLHTVSFYSPRKITNPVHREAVLSALAQDAASVGTTAQDPYFFGKQVALIGRLILIADDLGQTATASQLRESLKRLMQPWLEKANANYLMYDRTWGGICSKKGMEEFTADFGQGWYNDHHFHYGYFVYAAATIAKADPGWVSTYRDVIESLIRDYANPGFRDTAFPVLRKMDWYDGHSWASGLFDFADGKNQESSSEAVNAYYAVQLYGEATNNAHIRNLGRLLTATEIRATHKYWHIKSGSQVYPEPEFQAHKCIGIMWGSKIDYATWFGANVEFIHGIQYLPFTPITEILLPKDYMTEAYPVVATAYTRQNPPLLEGWKGLLFMAHAIIDKEAAWREVNTLRSFDDGNTKTNTLYWVATRP